MAKIWIPQFLFLAIFLLRCMATSHQRPAIFIFGDSTADVGTNSFLPHSRFRADFPHNGVDFPRSRPTGRYSNGLNSADFLAMLMGHNGSLPPFLSLSTTYALKMHSLRGINFASGGSGLLNGTGTLELSLNSDGIVSIRKMQNVVPMSEQIKQFSTIHYTLTSSLGTEETKKFLAKSLFLISTGGNDIFGYYHSDSKISRQQFMYTLRSAYENHLKNLLSLGARKFGIVSVPPIGCCPSQRLFNSSEGCLEELNEHAIAFHSIIGNILKKLSSEYTGMVYSLGNAFNMTMDVIKNPLPFKFWDVKNACCGAGKFNAEAICDPKASLCSRRDHYLFWDLYHPTEAASKLAAKTLFGGGPRYVYPINFAQLVAA